MIDEKWLMETFSHLHRHPERSGRETETARYISGRLGELGIPHTVDDGTHAVVGLLRGGAGPVVGLRADMDALPIEEPEDHAPRSEAPGVMHACGHDAHMTILLGLAKELAGQAFPGSVKLLFEPAEETIGGARDMIAKGCLENPRVDAVLGLHVDPELPVGQVRFRPGAMSGASDDLHITLLGRAAHGAYPHRGVDALAIAAQAVTALQLLISRETAPLDSAALTLGTIRGGTASNVIAERVELEGTLRTLEEATRARLIGRIRECVEGVAAALRGGAEVEIASSYPALYNDAGLTGVATRCLGGILGPEALRDMLPSLGVESFSFFAGRVPGFCYDLGCDSPGPIHTREFCVDPACLPLGVRLQHDLTLAVLAHLHSEAKEHEG